MNTIGISNQFTPQTINASQTQIQNTEEKTSAPSLGTDSFKAESGSKSLNLIPRPLNNNAAVEQEPAKISENTKENLKLAGVGVLAGGIGAGTAALAGATTAGIVALGVTGLALPFLALGALTAALNSWG